RCGGSRMNGDLDLEQRYRRVLRPLPGYYRDKWEEDMVAAFLGSWMTGALEEDPVPMGYDRPSRQEIARGVPLAPRRYLGGPGRRRRPGLPAAGPVGRLLGEAPRNVEFLVPARLRPGPGHGRVPPGRRAGRAPALATGPARLLPPGARAGAGDPGDRESGLAAGLGRAGLLRGRPRLPGARAQGPVPVPVSPGRRVGRVVAG